MRRLLIFTAVYTGHGHKSISDALNERLKRYEDIEVMTIDGFDLMTKMQKICAEKTYGPITRLPGKAWALNYAAGMYFMEPVQHAIAAMIRTRFEKLIREFRPDCILSVHPMFLGSILDLLEEMHLSIPVVAHEADLIDIALYWFDKRLSLVLAPSKESYDCTIRHGVDPSKVRQVGFPVRSRFTGLAQSANAHKNEKLTITVMSGSEGSGTLRSVVRSLLSGTDANVNVICGRNKAIRKKLRKAFVKKYYGRINAMGFVEKIQDVMCESDILVMRASPNSVLEAVALNKPIILFGQLAGQELHNPDMLQSHGVAVYCPEPERLPACIAELTANNGAGIERMRECQRKFAPTDAAEETAKLLNEYIVPYVWPDQVK